MAWDGTGEDTYHLCSHPLSIGSVHAFQVLPLLVCLMYCFRILHMPSYFGYPTDPCVAGMDPTQLYVLAMRETYRAWS